MAYHSLVFDVRNISAMVTQQVTALPRLGQWLRAPILGEGYVTIAKDQGVSEVRIQRTSGQVLFATADPAMVQLLASSMDLLVVLAVKYSAAQAQVAGVAGRKSARIADAFLAEAELLDPAALTFPNSYWHSLSLEIREGI